MKPKGIATGNNSVGKIKFKLYREAFSHINKAIEERYYLEAITLIESLLSDRLESRICYLTGKSDGFFPLGTLIGKIKKYEKDSEFKKYITTKVDSWRQKRNEALHEMVKIDQEKSKPNWEERFNENLNVAEEGYKVLRNVNSMVEKQKKKS